MQIQVGDQVPAGEFGVMTPDGPGSVSADEIFGGNKVVLFSVPGAFTPTCSKAHLPGFVAHADAIRGKGVDTIACLSVNDTWVMNAWGKDQSVGDSVMMLADGNGTYTEALGLSVDLSAGGMGKRGQRFVMIVDDGTVIHIAVEAPRQFDVSSAEAVLKAL
ncbi:MAG: peroxiredoxin [Gammaproteobacteria bacterium]|nr:peroxiredoxin [Gammaproteobacteria bacterium]